MLGPPMPAPLVSHTVVPLGLCLGLALGLTACRQVSATIEIADTPPPKRPREGSKREAQVGFDVLAALDGAERALLAVDELRTRPGPNAYDNGEMHSYLPDEGLRSLYYYATVAQVSLVTVGALFDTPVFATGAHTEHPNYFVADDFGRYNPEFVERVTATARALGRDPARVERTRLAFDRQLRRQAVTYLAVHEAMHRDPEWFLRYQWAYVQHIAEPGSGFSMSDEGVQLNDTFANAGMSWYEADTASFFWVRRYIDGTDTLWLAALQALLDAYGVERP